MFLKDDDCVQNEYYTYNRLFFKFIGLWQFQKSSKQLIYFYFINLIIVFSLFSQILILFNSESNITSITKLLETTLPTLCFGFCYYNLLLNTTVMKKILHRIKCDWEELENKPELVILKKYGNLSRMCTVTIAISLNLHIAFLILPSMVHLFLHIFCGSSETKLILPLVFDRLINIQINYFLLLLFVYICMYIICMLGVANYSMFIAIIQHACALFNIVSWRIQENINRSQHNVFHNNFAEERKWIVSTIEFYNNAVNFVDLLKSCYGTIYLFEGFFASIMIMVDYFYLFQILSFTLSTSEVIAKISYIIASLLVIFGYYYFGQKLIDNHTDVCTKLCQIPFYSLSLKTQKILLFLIMRCMKPCNLSVKGVIVISYYLFATLMRTSFSFAMVFYNLQLVQMN